MLLQPQPCCEHMGLPEAIRLIKENPAGFWKKYETIDHILFTEISRWHVHLIWKWKVKWIIVCLHWQYYGIVYLFCDICQIWNEPEISILSMKKQSLEYWWNAGNLTY